MTRTIKRSKGNWIGNILRRNYHLQRVIDGKSEILEDEEEDVSSYWMALRKQKG